MLIWLSCSFHRYIRIIILDEMNENKSNHINDYTEKIFKYLMEQDFTLWKTIFLNKDTFEQHVSPCVINPILEGSAN